MKWDIILGYVLGIAGVQMMWLNNHIAIIGMILFIMGTGLITNGAKEEK